MSKLHISDGNIKLGNISNINLPPILACKKGVPCASEKLCYAIKSFRQYPNVRKAWNENFQLYKNNPNDYYSELENYLKKKKRINRFRWHSSGDIIDQNYFEMMKDLAKNFPKINFLAYTKNDLIDFNNPPSNLTIRFSYWPGYSNNSNLDHFAWMKSFVQNKKNKNLNLN